jgi:hypothetical protein
MASRKPDIKELVDLNIRSIKDTQMRYLMYDMISKIKLVWEYQDDRITELEAKVYALENP